MADKKESALGAVTDFAQARVLDASGASKNIDKATMASVLAEASYKTLGVTEGMQNGESVTINTIDYGMKDHYVIFVNTQIGYSAIVQIRYGNASVVHETFEDYYSFSVAASSDLLTVTLKYTGTRNTKLSYRVL